MNDQKFSFPLQCMRDTTTQLSINKEYNEFQSTSPPGNITWNKIWRSWGKIGNKQLIPNNAREGGATGQAHPQQLLYIKLRICSTS